MANHLLQQPEWTLALEGRLGEALPTAINGHTLPVTSDAQVMRDAEWTHAASAGWGNDGWRLFDSPGGRAVLLDTIWDSTDDAAEFAAAARPGENGVVHLAGDRVLVVAADDAADVSLLMAAAQAALSR